MYFFREPCHDMFENYKMQYHCVSFEKQFSHKHICVKKKNIEKEAFTRGRCDETSKQSVHEKKQFSQ